MRLSLRSVRLLRGLPAVFMLVPLVAVACGDAQPSPCEKFPNAAACRPKNAATGSFVEAGAPITVYATPPTAVVAADAGAARDAAVAMKPDGGRPQVPPAQQACGDLGRCCSKIKSTIEKAACMAVAYGGKPSTCATAVIGYQLLGCGHSPFSLPTGGSSGGTQDDDGDGTPDFVDPDSEADVTLEDYCASYPSDEVCTDVTTGGAGAYDSDPCVQFPNNFECQEPSTDPFAGDPDFVGPPDPFGPPDPTDPFGPPDPTDPFGPPDPFDPFDPSDPSDPGDPFGGFDPDP
ncbi:MAG: hypothetical protein IPG50_12485 [Myxococcales bacterium]|nr:hypothetical protein [Myxococcales bacterium]